MRRKACTGKIRHIDKAAADLVYRKVRRTTGYMEPYKCRWCGGWHLGHARRE